MQGLKTDHLFYVALAMQFEISRIQKSKCQEYDKTSLIKVQNTL